MVKGLLDSTSTSNDFYTVFDNLVATNPQLEKTITEVRNESNIFLCKVLKFYPYRDMAYVQLLDDGSKHYCHLTHEMLSYEVSLNCMCDGSVKTDNVYGSYVEPFNDIYGIVANVRFRGSTDEKCLLSCLNYDDNNDLKSSVRNGEIKFVVGDSTLSLTRSRINLMTPTLLVNGLPYDEPNLKNYYDKSEINTIKSDTDAQIDELSDRIVVPCGFSVSGDELVIDYCGDATGVDGSILDLIEDLSNRIDDIEQGEVDLSNLDVDFDVQWLGHGGLDDRIKININLVNGA